MPAWLAGVFGAVAGALIVRLVDWGVTTLPVLADRLERLQRDVNGLGKRMREELASLREEMRRDRERH